MLHLHLSLIAQDELKSDFLHVFFAVLQVYLHPLLLMFLLFGSYALLEISRDSSYLVLDLRQLRLLSSDYLLELVLHLGDLVAVGVSLVLELLNLDVLCLQGSFDLVQFDFHAGQVLEAIAFLLLQCIPLKAL